MKTSTLFTVSSGVITYLFDFTLTSAVNELDDGFYFAAVSTRRATGPRGVGRVAAGAISSIVMIVLAGCRRK